MTIRMSIAIISVLHLIFSISLSGCSDDKPAPTIRPYIDKNCEKPREVPMAVTVQLPKYGEGAISVWINDELVLRDGWNKKRAGLHRKLKLKLCDGQHKVVASIDRDIEFENTGFVFDPDTLKYGLSCMDFGSGTPEWGMYARTKAEEKKEPEIDLSKQVSPEK